MESEGEHGFSEMSEEVLHHTTYDIHITHLIHNTHGVHVKLHIRGAHLMKTDFVKCCLSSDFEQSFLQFLLYLL